MKGRAVTDILFDFLEQTAMRNQFRECLMIMRSRITKVQLIRRGAMNLMNCKMQVLVKIWNREQNHLAMVAIKSKDKKIRAMVAEYNLIKDEVKLAILKKYLFMCSIKHSLAFFQWRYHNCA